MTEKKKPDLLSVLEKRFSQHPKRHDRVLWKSIETILMGNADALQIIDRMEKTGGEPDVLVFNDTITYCDCAKESPSCRRSLCYDDEALAARKENRPAGSAIGLAKEIGISLLNEERYRMLQECGEYDMKTSSWIETPAGIRKLGGALFGDRRYDHVFVYHNGAESYYSVRGFRGYLEIGTIR